MSSAWKLVHDDGPVWQVTNGTFASNCYLCGTGDSGECFVVDPGLEPSLIDAALADLKLCPKAVVCTHGHFDHLGGAAHFRRAHGCTVYLDSADVKTMRSSNFLLMAFKIDARIDMVETVDPHQHGSLVQIGQAQVRFHRAPGHTPGSCILEYGSSLFTGDSIYSRGVGLSKLPGEDPRKLRQSILDVWERFPNTAMVHPGHGESAQLGWIKENNLPLRRFLQQQPEGVQQT